MVSNIIKFLFIVALGWSNASWAVNCQSTATPLENSICNSDELNWLDYIVKDLYHKKLVENDAIQVRHAYQEWKNSLEKCTSASCLERAYYGGISQLADVDHDFNWEGLWWNRSAPHLSGDTIQFSNNTEWNVTLNIRAWAGRNQDTFWAEARKQYGMALVKKIRNTSACQLLLIPEKGGTLHVYSNAERGCQLSLPVGAWLDGNYEEADHDPRTTPTLVSLGIFKDTALDEAFRNLTGSDYQNFVDTANVYVPGDDLDNIGARVISMWVQGAANTMTAIIMYTPKGDIWAARINPGPNGPELHYYSTAGNDLHTMPRTLASWKLRFLEL